MSHPDLYDLVALLLDGKTFAADAMVGTLGITLSGELKETLPLHRLGVFPQLGLSLMTTNCLDSLNSLVEQRVGKVDHWRTSNQTQRWLAAALLEIEPRLRRIKGFRALLLRQVLRTPWWVGKRPRRSKPPDIMTRSSLREDQLNLALTRNPKSGLSPRGDRYFDI